MGAAPQKHNSLLFALPHAHYLQVPTKNITQWSTYTPSNLGEYKLNRLAKLAWPSQIN